MQKLFFSPILKKLLNFPQVGSRDRLSIKLFSQQKIGLGFPRNRESFRDVHRLNTEPTNYRIRTF